MPTIFGSICVANSNLYTPGGTVGRGIYITRQADDNLLRLCQAGEYAYVLTSRQMGKSSLMVKTAKRLQSEGIFSVTIDLTKIGKTDVTPESWYQGVLLEIENEIEDQGQALTTDIYDWWSAHPSLTITQRFIRFFRDVLLPELDGRVVVFIDEIDTTRSLDFTDDFFIAIRAMYTARAQTKIYERLSFVLIGAATPANLIDDPHRTPFNIGHRVDLTDFTLTEAQPLATGLGIEKADRAEVFERILAWTDGHPYLTQRLCIEVARQSRPRWAEADVDEVVSQLFFGDRRHSDDHLKLVGAWLSDPEKVPDLYQVLTTYRSIWRDRQPVLDEKQSLTKSHLKMSGVVKRGENNALRVRNQIYQTVFDDQWIADHLPVNWGKRIQQLRGTIAASFLLVGIMAGLTGWAMTERQTATAARRTAEEQRQVAENQRQEAIKERDKARQAESLAERRLGDVEAAREAEAEQRQQADLRTVEAQEATQRALLAQQAEAEQRQRAEAGEQESNYQAEVAKEAQQQSDENAARAQHNADEADAQRRIAQNQALNSDIETRSLTIETLLSLQRNTQAFWSALELGRYIQDLDNRANSQTVALNKNLHSGEELPPGTVNSSSRLQAASVLDKIYYLNGYLKRQTLTVTVPGDRLTQRSQSKNSYTPLALVRYRRWFPFTRHQSEVRSVSFSPDGQMIASASSNGTVKLWDVSGRERQTLTGHQNEVLSVSFSPDGQTIASASYDRTVKLWDVSGRERQTLTDHQSEVWSVSFSPDGQTIASASSDGTIILWDLNLERLLENSCEWWRDYLTYGNASDEKKSFCPHITPTQPLHSAPWLWGRDLLGLAAR